MRVLFSFICNVKLRSQGQQVPGGIGVKVLRHLPNGETTLNLNW